MFAEEIEETQAASEAMEVETEAPVTEAPTTEPPVPETDAPEETSAPTEPQTTTEVTEATASTGENIAPTEPTEETTEPALDLFAEDGNVVASGTCGAQGDNLTWVLAGDGTLTISGSGEMKDYSTSSVAPWYIKRTKILSVVVEDGVTCVGDYAFYACLKLASVTLPEGINSIGCASFQDCAKLAEVNIPNSVTRIGNQTFQGCSKLTSVTIPEGVTSIDYGVFFDCSSLTSVSIPEGVTSIGTYAFYGCSGLTSVTIPEGVTSIGDSAFYGCSSLTSVTIPEGVTSIDYGVFSGCSSLTSVTIPEGVTSIGIYAFHGCSGLTSVTIPEGVTSIGDWAFNGCDAITDVYYSGTEEEWQAIEIGNYNDALSDATIHYNYVHIHNLEHIPGKTATCTEAGNLEYWHCLDCDEYFADADCTQVISEVDTVLPALGHDMAKVEAVAPTYVAAGNNEYYTCSRCGKAFKDELGEIETTVEEETLPKLDKGDVYKRQPRWSQLCGRRHV